MQNRYKTNVPTKQKIRQRKLLSCCKPDMKYKNCDVAKKEKKKKYGSK